MRRGLNKMQSPVLPPRSVNVKMASFFPFFPSLSSEQWRDERLVVSGPVSGVGAYGWVLGAPGQCAEEAVLLVPDGAAASLPLDAASPGCSQSASSSSISTTGSNPFRARRRPAVHRAARRSTGCPSRWRVNQIRVNGDRDLQLTASKGGG